MGLQRKTGETSKLSASVVLDQSWMFLHWIFSNPDENASGFFFSLQRFRCCVIQMENSHHASCSEQIYSSMNNDLFLKL